MPLICGKIYIIYSKEKKDFTTNERHLQQMTPHETKSPLIAHAFYISPMDACMPNLGRVGTMFSNMG